MSEIDYLSNSIVRLIYFFRRDGFQSYAEVIASSNSPIHSVADRSFVSYSQKDYYNLLEPQDQAVTEAVPLFEEDSSHSKTFRLSDCNTLSENLANWNVGNLNESLLGSYSTWTVPDPRFYSETYEDYHYYIQEDQLAL